eukprot:gnl/MRDRNA2_/MRDRNA2_131252_c0_seq1.p1 gnl/MRDRNA2_/MRDRNA2_131252_c0~~gnl/MRDRNA2_/MRDRNA2_131252_c0_seq1.p1  ORF type:complete len:336 (+),score=54.71 gnl/MRDRNA2_/MRDRNA2_131252_c0_seq1:69-1076(+)
MEALGVQVASQLHSAIQARNLKKVQEIWRLLGSPNLHVFDASLEEWWSRRTDEERSAISKSDVWLMGEPTTCVDTLVNLGCGGREHPVDRRYSALLKFLQSHGSRVSMKSLVRLNSYYDLADLARKGLNLEGVDLTDIRDTMLSTDCFGCGSPLFSCDFTALLSCQPGFGEPGGSHELLQVLRPLIAAGMQIYPFDGSNGPPDNPPKQSNDQVKRDVVRALWPGQTTTPCFAKKSKKTYGFWSRRGADDEEENDNAVEEKEEGLLLEWRADELMHFRRLLAAALANERWRRRRLSLFGYLRGKQQNASGVGLLLLNLKAHSGEHSQVVRIVFEFL